VKKKRIHIDELFRNGLKNLSLFVSDRDLNAIDDKKSQYSDSNPDIQTNAFSDFELQVSDADWEATMAKLDKEKASLTQENVYQKAFASFELQPEANDWQETYRKYINRKRRRTYTWLGTGVILLIALIGFVTLLNRPADKTLAAQDLNHNSQTPTAQETHKNTTVPENKTNTAEAERSLKLLPKTEPVSKTQSYSDEELNILPEKLIQKMQVRTKPKADRNSGNSISDKAADGSGNSKDLNENKSQFKTTESLSESIRPNEKLNPSVLSETPAESKEPIQEVQETVNEPSGEDQNKAQQVAAQDPIAQDTTRKKSDKDKGTKKPGSIPALGIYAGIINRFDYTSSNLINSDGSRYSEIRKNSDRPMFQYTTGLEVGLKFSNFMFNTGLQTTTQNWKSKYNYTYKIYDSIPVYDTGHKIIGYFLRNPRDKHINETQEVRINKIQIPLELGYSFKINERFGFNCMLNAILSYNSSSSGGKMLNPENMQLYPYETMKKMERSFNVLPGFAFGLQAGLGKGFSIQGNLSGNGSLYSRFTNASAIQDYPYSIGLNIKLLYKLK
jgi:hypothetical protein